MPFFQIPKSLISTPLLHTSAFLLIAEDFIPTSLESVSTVFQRAALWAFAENFSVNTIALFSFVVN
ncbi:hypothetical protein I79_013111 [Cricetulus griseus]|uniref:Uncharacterized protein n=1 Tax=Cricetulus griseus TaxID=10029 RepID=G3HQK7_CRIGR|nr:hypothetical protein I79_013111 [Cricetulus griseus]